MKPTPKSSLEYSDENGSMVITSVIRSETDVVIPDMINGLPVTEIGKECFHGSEQLTSVVLPSRLKKIGGASFTGCTNLASVVISEGLETIEDFVFADCTRLISINLPESLTTLEEEAFRGCTGLASIVLPPHLKKLGSSAFYDCTNLKSVVFTGSLKELENSMFLNCTNLSSVKLPEGLKVIGLGSFGNCSNLRSIQLPEGLETIEPTVFKNCSKLIRIAFPKSLKTVSALVFSGCTQLKEFVVPNGNMYFKSIDGVLFSKDGSVLISCPAGKSGDYTVPAGVKVINEYAFDECCGLTSITFPDGLEEIGHYAFGSCHRLLISVPSICCFSYEVLSCPKRIPDGAIVKKYFGSETEVAFPDEIHGVPVIELEKDAFQGTPVECILWNEKKWTLDGFFRAWDADKRDTLEYFANIANFDEDHFESCMKAIINGETCWREGPFAWYYVDSEARQGVIFLVFFYEETWRCRITNKEFWSIFWNVIHRHFSKAKIAKPETQAFLARLRKALGLPPKKISA